MLQRRKISLSIRSIEGPKHSSEGGEKVARDKRIKTGGGIRKGNPENLITKKKKHVWVVNFTKGSET